MDTNTHTHALQRWFELHIKTDKINIMHSYCVCLYVACVRESGSNMWIYVFLGNALRGIGETPVTPLGISYIDDFAKAENSPFYIGKYLLVYNNNSYITNAFPLAFNYNFSFHHHIT